MVVGKGSEIGDHLTTHPAVNCISFTGGDTGLSICKKVRHHVWSYTTLFATGASTRLHASANSVATFVAVQWLVRHLQTCKAKACHFCVASHACQVYSGSTNFWARQFCNFTKQPYVLAGVGHLTVCPGVITSQPILHKPQ